jgi:hypothetical protein
MPEFQKDQVIFSIDERRRPPSHFQAPLLRLNPG